MIFTSSTPPVNFHGQAAIETLFSRILGHHFVYYATLGILTLTPPANTTPKLVGYTGAEWAEDNTNYKSASNFLFMYGDGPIS